MIKVMNILVLVSLFIGSPTTAQEHGTFLAGVVIDAETGEPIEKALVSVLVARPKQGPALMCPTCYPDCEKWTQADAEGRFRIEQLDASLEFRLAIGAIGYTPRIFAYAPPLKSGESTYELTKAEVSDKDNPNVRVIQGSVRSRDGQAIPGAVVQAKQLFSGGRLLSRSPDVPRLTLADKDGTFSIPVAASVGWIDFHFSAPGYAPAQIRCTSSQETIDVKLGAGASLSGQLTFDGKPMKGVRLGLVQTNRSIGNLITRVSVATDDKGYFRFDSVPARREYAVYTVLNQKSAAALPVSIVRAPKDGMLAELGEIECQKASTITLDLVAPENSTLPDNGTVYIGRGYSSHGLRMVLGKDALLDASQPNRATLVVKGVPRNKLEISVRIDGFEVAETVPHLSKDLNRYLEALIENDQRFELRLVRESAK